MRVVTSNGNSRWARARGLRQSLSRVGPARFERRPTISNHRELPVGRRSEAPLVPPDILSSFKVAMAVGGDHKHDDHRRLTTLSAKPLSPRMMLSLPFEAIFSKTSNSRSRMRVGLSASRLAVLA